MQISSNSLYDIGTKYTIKLNEKEMLVVEEDPRSRAIADSKKAQQEKETQEQKSQKEENSSSVDELSQDEERLVQDLEARDSEVRAHESSHQAAGGGMVGAASYTYQQGPDGKMYAIGGEVPINIPTGSTPEESIANARQAAAAAMAVADPSPADYSVAASARVMEMQAQQQKAKEALEQAQGRETYLKEASSFNTQEKTTVDLGFDISA